ncbi:MAG: EAL domain-containing protein [Leptolyngbyaceae cyanobacterium SM2_5_2]|nr:EAL domain-containing protein [Leptolyngbyaceae cyanobacterium SM2_5_2]
MIDPNVIRNALAEGDFYLEYQPIMQIDERRCIGAEALLRWCHQGEERLPAEFIEGIENTPSSGVLTYWVIEKVAQELGTWLHQARDDISISINVPPELLGRGGLEYAMFKSGLIDISEKIVFEITERGIPDKLGIDGLNQRPYHVRIALDDVGITAAKLIMFAQLRIDVLKLDKSFVHQLLTADGQEDNLGRLAAMIRESGIDIIAEGVESADQAFALLAVGVTKAQGWYFSYPLPCNEFLNFFEAHQGG